jgi:hypothetical protein
MFTDKCYPTGLEDLKKEIADISSEYLRSVLCADDQKNTVFLDKYAISSRDEKSAMAYSLTKNEMEALIEFLPNYLLKNASAEVADIFLARYRRYVFRRMFVVWQDYYHNKAFCRIFAALLEHDDSGRFTQECVFTPEELKKIVLSENVPSYVIDEAKNSPYGLIGYFSVHNFYKGCRLALDCMSVFFLFCSEKDY